MPFIADLHIHSHFSRACSKTLDPENLHYWAQLKGVTVVGTGDFTHPGWFDELQEKLVEAEPGLFRLRPELAQPFDENVPRSCRAEVRFLLSAEISSIYKKGDRTRKVHNVIFVPDFQTAGKFASELAKVGNIASDGRPILGLDSRSLLEIVLDSSPDAFLVPAHIWTPHFSALGAASEFNSIEECYEDLTPHIFAVETGLSSDPPMNWRLSALDRYTLISDSDAHSPAKLMREANVFDTDLSYFSMRDALKSGDPEKWLGTIEFFPEEGKYHFDGHRKCRQRLSPSETREYDGKCPVCGKKITVGVLNRVESLADREEGFTPPRAAPFRSLVPLAEVLAEVYQQGDKTKRVQNEYFRLLDRFGSEYQFLTETPLGEIGPFSSPLLAKAIRRLRTATVEALAGYDGEYGVIHALTDADRQENSQQLGLFGEAVADSPVLEGLNAMQREAVEAPEGPLLLVAGAGTGKTNTLTRRLAYSIFERGVRPEAILAVTFTQKAAAEIRKRVAALLEDDRLASRLQVGTIHSISARLLQQFGEGLVVPAGFRIADEALQLAFAKEALATAWDPPDLRPKQLLELLAPFKCRRQSDASEAGAPRPTEESLDGTECSAEALQRLLKGYQAALQRHDTLDFEDLILKSTELFRHPEMGPTARSGFSTVMVDEAQDLNDAQYDWLRALTADHEQLVLVGDPDQSIYSFRGSNARTFRRFLEDCPSAKTLRLEENYRSPKTVLDAAEQLIANDPERLPKRLFTSRTDGRKAQLWECESSRIEAARVVSAIEEMVEETSMERRDAKGPELPLAGVARSFADIAILTRTNAQHFAFAEALRKAGIPFQAAAAVRKKPSAEIRELLAMLRLAASTEDREALEDLLLSTVKGVGEKTIEALQTAATERGVSLYDALNQELTSSNWKPALKRALTDFLDALNGLKAELDREGLVASVRQRLADTGLLREAAKDPDALFLQVLAARYGSESPEGQAAALKDFLAEAALRLESDLLDPRTESVKLLTIHAAKGMEFPVVFVSGVEEGLLPVSEAQGSDEVLHEERRLLYVAMTRARELLVLSHCRSRFIYGAETPVSPSRFLEELPTDQFEQKVFERQTSKRREMENAQLRLF